MLHSRHVDTMMNVLLTARTAVAARVVACAACCRLPPTVYALLAYLRALLSSMPRACSWVATLVTHGPPISWRGWTAFCRHRLTAYPYPRRRYCTGYTPFTFTYKQLAAAVLPNTASTPKRRPARRTGPVTAGFTGRPLPISGFTVGRQFIKHRHALP